MLGYVSIHNKESTSFHTDGLGQLFDFVFEPEVTERYGYLECQFTYALDGMNAEHIKQGNIVVLDVNQRQSALPFEIYQCEPEYVSETIEVRARVLIVAELKKRSVPELKFNHELLETALSNVKAVLQAPLEYRQTCDVSARVTAEYGESNAYDVLIRDEQSLMNLSKAQVLFYDNGLSFQQQRGRKKTTIIRKESNLIQSMSIRYNRDELVTRIIPFTTIMNDKVVQGEHGGQRETEETKVYGNPVLSGNVAKYQLPIVTKYVEYRNETIDKRTVSVPRGEDKDDREIELNVYKYQSVSDLNKEASRFFEVNTGIDMEKITAELDLFGFHQSEETMLGLYDTIEFYSEKYDVDIELQVAEVVYLPLTRMIKQVKFESVLVSLDAIQNKMNQGRLSSGALSEKVNAENEKYNAIFQRKDFFDKLDGTRLNFVSELPPVESSREGDIAFIDKGDSSEIWEFKDGAWHVRISKEFGRELQGELDKIKSRAEALNQSIQNTNTQVEAISRKATGAESAAERAKAIAEETRVSVTNRLSNIRSDVHEILQANFDRLKGQSSYLHVAYASDVSGSRVTGFSKTDTTGKEWLGTQSTSSATASDNPNDYTWVKLPQGEPGRDGVALTNILKDSYTLKSLHYIGLSPNTPNKKVEVLTEDTGEKFVRLTVKGLSGQEYFGVALHLYVDALAQGDKLSYNIQYREQPTIAPIDRGVAFEVKRFRHPQVWVTSHVNFPRTNNSEWHTLKGTVNVNKSADGLTHSFYVYLRQNGCVDIKLPMLVKGDKVPEDYSANPADAILEISTFSANYERDNQRVKENLQELQRKFNSNGELIGLAEFKRQYEATARSVSEQLSAHDRSISGATNTITNLNREMNAVKGSLETKVNQSEYNQLNGRVTTAESSIRQTATELAKKISRSDFDPVNQKVTTLYNDTKETVEAFKRVLGSDESTVRRNFLKAARTENLVKNPRFEFQLAEWTQQYLDGSTQTFRDRPDGVSGDKASLRVKASSRITSGCNIHQRINVGELYRDQTIVVGANVAMNNAPNSGTIFEMHVKYESATTTRTETITIDRYRIRTNYWSWFERQLTVPIDCHAITLSIYFNRASRNSIDLFITDVTLAVTDMSLGGPIRAAFDTAYSAVEQTKEYIRTELFKTTGSDSGTTSLRTFIESVAGSKTERYTKQEVENRINASKNEVEQRIRGQFQHVESDHAKLERLFGTTQNGEVTHFARQLVTNEIFTTEIQNAVPRNLVADGYVNDTSTHTYIGTRTLRLERGKKYTFTVCGKVTGSASGKKLTVWLSKEGNWADRYSLVITNDTLTTAHITFTSRDTGEYKIVTTLAPNSGDRQGTVLWYVVTEGTHVAKAYINNDEAVASKVHQLSNSWGVNIRSANDVITNLNLNASGVKIKGKFIELDGDVSIDKAFVNNMFVQMITGDTATFDRGTFAYVLAEHINVNRLTGRKIEFIEAAFRDDFGVVKITGSDIKIDSYQDWDVLLDRRGMMITNASGTPMGSFVGYIDKGTGNDSGIAMIAKKGYELSLGYDGEKADNVFNSALIVDGTTGHIIVNSDLYPHKGKEAVGLRIANRDIGGDKCVYLYVPDSPGYGIAIGRSGVYVLNNDRYTKLGSSY